MQITKEHYRYWIYKTVKVSFYQPSEREIGSVDIHSLIPCEEKIDKHCRLHNLLVILKGKRKRGESLRKALHEMHRVPGCSDGQAQRRAFCGKWLEKLGEFPRDLKSLYAEKNAIACKEELTQQEENRLFELNLRIEPKNSNQRIEEIYRSKAEREREKRIVKEIVKVLRENRS